MWFSKSWLCWGLLLGCSLTLLVTAETAEDPDAKKGKICIGTNGRMSVPKNREHHYRNLRDRYINCTYVDGNLELTWLENDTVDLSYLNDIREVTGYILISHVNVRRVVLPNLQIIRGRTLFKLPLYDEEFALFVTLSKMHTLELPNLRDILRGSVGIINNYNLCHMRSIRWEEIITGINAKYVYMYNFSEPERACAACSSECEGGCWGEGKQNCQKFSKTNCSPQCHQGRCFGPQPRECCHLFCAGGCTGPKQSDCLACRNFYDEGVCKQECPPMQRYNPITYSWEPNPEGKYAYGATCVKNCPEHLLKDNGACVRTCPPKKKPVNGECVPCDGPCPKTCSGVEVVHSGNIDSFRDCTTIDGSLTILETSFQGFQDFNPDQTLGPRYASMHPRKLEVFSTVKSISGYLNIQASHPDFTDLSYFRNVEEIGGRQFTEYFAALYIIKTSLKSLGLRSLKAIRSGSIAILENKDLCFASSIEWKKLLQSDTYTPSVANNKPQEGCIADGLVCHPECSKEGCWGPYPSDCLSCAAYTLETTCVRNCDDAGIYYAGKNRCDRCHEECELTCAGAGPSNCSSCKNARDGPFCVTKCPSMKFNLHGECLPCHENCIDGCTGPSNFIGPGGCDSCEKALLSTDEPPRIERCLRATEQCPESYYSEWVGPQEVGVLKSLAGKLICKRCHPRCKSCTGYGFHLTVCQECMQYRSKEQCEDRCPSEHYADEINMECKKCSDECRECHGPGLHQCTVCRNFRIYGDPDIDGNITQFNCTSSCPDEKPYKIFPDSTGEPFCSDADPALMQSAAVGDSGHLQIFFVLGGAFFLLSLVVAVGLAYRCHIRAKNKQDALKMTMRMTGLEDSEPLKPTNVKPNLAQLRIVKEAELRKGGILGYGAFGTVYRGVWVPEGENIKIPVAIKVLREGTGTNTNTETLEEAYIMASIEHPHLLKLLAVCMTSQMMLVTQLMPLGCLLDYVRNNKSMIGSKPLLLWCKQIAQGMAYLENLRLVHRDLAARNVLVQTPGCVKITDFGLAKLLDYNEDEYKAAGGKMPIKWLALECIQHRRFTHKSDVWAFGVTVWELLTYGGRPYENVPAREVPDLLEKGERLPQPTIATLDLYMIMIKCWMLDAESRPSFKELEDVFAKMVVDPGRYLVILGDKLMRLPTYTPQDEKEMLRSLSATAGDGPEVFMDAEEYLQPKSNTPVNSNPNTTSECSTPPPNTPTKSCSVDYEAMFREYPRANSTVPPGAIYSSGPIMNDKVSTWNGSYPHPAISYPNHVMRQTVPRRHREPGGSTSGSEMRYSGDPLEQSGVAYPEMMAAHPQLLYDKRGMKVNNLRLGLPVDDDDYLMPSPRSGTTGNPSTAGMYMDLIGECRSGDSGVGSPTTDSHQSYNPDFPFTISHRHYPSNGSNHRPVPGLDNPEYHLMNNGLPNGVLRGGPLPTPGVLTTPLTCGLPSPSHQPSMRTIAPYNGTGIHPSIALGQRTPFSVSGANSHNNLLDSGIGPSSGSSSSGASASSDCSQHIPTVAPLRRKTISEDESDHEYYNDLTGELEPLNHRRSETTV